MGQGAQVRRTWVRGAGVGKLKSWSLGQESGSGNLSNGLGLGS